MELLAALIAVSEALFFPVLTFSTVSIASDYLSRHLVPKRLQPLPRVVAEISYYTKCNWLDSNFSSIKAESNLIWARLVLSKYDFSSSDKRLVLSILKRTDFLENLDIEFNQDEIREQMLFTFALAEYTCLVPLAHFHDIYQEQLRKK